MSDYNTFDLIKSFIYEASAICLKSVLMNQLYILSVATIKSQTRASAHQ